MTTPNGQPSVQPSATDLGESLQDPGIANDFAAAYSAAGGERPNIIGTNMTDVDGRYTEGATVGDDQSAMGLTAPADTDASQSAMADWHVAQGVSHPEAPGLSFCTVDTPDDDQDPRYLPDLNSAMHFLVGNKLKFGDRIIMDGAAYARNLVVDKAIHGDRLCFDVKGIGLPEGITELFNPEDLILWMSNVLQPGDIVAYLSN